MNIVVSILIAVLCFGIIIIFHELGHFCVAKLFNFKVNEFAIGMGPVVWSKIKGETKYSLRAFPIGGFCSMEGEEDGLKNEKEEGRHSESDSRSFGNKPVYQRFLVTVAGAIMNIVLGFIILAIITSCFGHKTLLPSNIVGGFYEGSVTSEQLRAGDKILVVNNLKVITYSDVSYELIRDTDKMVDFIVLRDGEKVELTNVKLKILTDENGKETIEQDFKWQGLKKTFFSVIKHTLTQTLSIARLIWRSVIDLFTGHVGINELSGPIGVTSEIGKAASKGIEDLLWIFTFITINIGIFNLIPFPALDGGRIIFLLIELVIRKPINRKYEGMINFVGFVLLMLLILFTIYNDVFKLFAKG